jgi:hypothetical protein
MTRGGTATGDEFWRGNGTNTSLIAIGGRDIAGTEIKVGEITIRYSQSGEHTFTVSNLGFDLPEDEEDLTKLGKLLRIGYNGQPYRYFLRESLDGYTFIPGLPDYTLNEDTIAIPRIPTTASFHYELATNRYDGFSSDVSVSNSLIRLSGTKDWVDSTNLFDTRPNGAEPYLSPGGQPGVTLRVFRAIADSTPGRIRPNTFEEITGSVDIVWTKTAGNDNRWNYVVNAKATLEPGMPPVGVAPGGAGTSSGTTLYRFSLTGDEFIYFVEEVGVNHHYHTPERTAGAAIPTAMIGAAFVPPTDAGNLRLMASGGTDKITGFRNTLRTTTVPVAKVWEMQNADGSAMPMNLDNLSALEMMIPASITFRLEYREVDTAAGDTVENPWGFFNQPGTGNPYTIVRTRQEIVSALRSSNSNQMSLTFNNPLLPQFGSLPEIRREYRFVETYIGSEEVTTVGSGLYAGGFDISYDSPSNRTVTNTLRTIPLTIRKEWDDDDGRDGYRPDTVTFWIRNQNGVRMEVTLCASNSADLRDSNNVLYDTTGNNNILQNTFLVPEFLADGATRCIYTVEELVGETDREKAARDEPHYAMESGDADNPAISQFTIGDPGPDVSGPKLYSFINSRDYLKIELPVQKDWSDTRIGETIGVDVDSIRSSSVTVRLEQSETGAANSWIPVGLPVTLSSSNNWRHTFDDLTARFGDGTPYFYRIVEVPVPGYIPTYRHGLVLPGTDTFSTTEVTVTEANASDGITVRNRLDVVNLTVVKDWSGYADNPFAKTGDVVVQLMYRSNAADDWISAVRSTDGQPHTITLTGAQSALSWTGTFTNLPKANYLGQPYHYSIRELSIGGVPFETVARPYSAIKAYTHPNTEPPATAKVLNTLDTRNDIRVTKIWDDRDPSISALNQFNQDGIRPPNVDIRLVANPGTPYEIIHSPATNVRPQVTNNWTYVFANLPMYRPDGELAVYHVHEVAVTSYNAPQYRVGDAGDYTIGEAITGSSETLPAGTLLSSAVPDTPGINVNVKNSYQPKTMSITAEKVWNDFETYYPTRPEFVMLQLYVSTDPGGISGRSPVGIPVRVEATASSLTSWKHTWDDLPIRQNTTGTPLASATSPGISQLLYYTIVEVGAVGYTPAYTYRLAGSTSTVTTGISGNIAQTAPPQTHLAYATNTLDKVDITVNKVWDDLVASDETNQFATRGNVEVKLYYRVGNSSAFIEAPPASTSGGNTRILTQAGGWTNTFENLPRRNSAGVFYQYMVRETKIGNVLVDEAASPPVFPFSYSSSSSETVATAGPGAPTDPITVTNTLQTRSNITVNKIWDDSFNQDGRRPDTVEVRLIRDRGVPGQEIISSPVTLSASNGWTHTWHNLPKYMQDGVTRSSYHVAEIRVNHYDVPDFRLDGSEFAPGVSGVGAILSGMYVSSGYVRGEDTPATFTVRNSYTPQVMSITADKIWNDQNNLYDTRPEVIQLRLYRTTDPGGVIGRVAVDTVTISAGSTPAAWTHTWNDLPIKQNTTGEATPPGQSQLLYYTIEELNADGTSPIRGYTQSYDYTSAGMPPFTGYINTTGNIDSTENSYRATVTNTLRTVTFNVTKEWNTGTTPPEVNPFASPAPVVVQLLVRQGATLSEPVPTDWAVAPGTDTTRNITTAPWTASFNNLPLENSAGRPFEYTVREISIGNTDFDFVDIMSPNTNFPYSFSSSVVEAGNGDSQSATVTNKLETRSITVNKIWEDNNNQDGRRPETVTVYLIKDMDRPDERIISAPVTLNASEGWTHEFENLPKYKQDGETPSTYHVAETKIIHYDPAEFMIGTTTSPLNIEGSVPELEGTWVSGEVEETDTVVDITNKYTPQTMTITATKVWSDRSDAQSTRPTSVRLRLLVTDGIDPPAPVSVSGVPHTVTVSGPSWSTGEVWSGLPLMQNTGGASLPLIYTVVELNTNDDLRPIHGYHAPTIVYSGGNSTAAGIVGILTNPTDTHTAVVTNTCDTLSSITVNKVWRDADMNIFSDTYVNKFVRTAPVDVRLYYRLAGSGDTGWTARSDTLQLSEANNWTGTFTYLPRNAYGTAFEYTVREIKVDGVDSVPGKFPLSYQSSAGIVDAMLNPTGSITVTNTLVKRNDITVTKDWNDEHNQDGIRPDLVQVCLIKDMGIAGQEIISDPVTLTAANGWTHTFKNLPRYNAIGEESTYHVMEVPLSDTSGYSLTGYRVGSATEFACETPDAGAAAGMRVSNLIENSPDTHPATAVTIRNSYTPKVMSLTAVKHWEDADDHYYSRPAEIRLQLYVTTNSDGITGRAPVAGPEGLVTVEPTGDPAAWTHTWSSLPVKRNTGDNSIGPGESVELYYSVEELGPGTSPTVHGYSTGYTYKVADGSSGVASGSGVRGDINDANNTTHSVDITNTLETVNVTVRKTWNDLVTSGTNPFAIRDDVVVRLYYRIGTGGDFIAAPISTTGENTRTLTQAGGWTGVFANLPRTDGNGIAYEYMVREISIGGTPFSAPPSTPVFPLSYSSSSSTSVMPGDSTVDPDAITVTNTLQTRGDITVIKQWDDNNNQDGLRPEFVEVRLIKDMGLGGVNESASEYVTLSAPNWSHTFTNLPGFRADGTAYAEYRVQEKPVLNYQDPVYQVVSGPFTEVDGSGLAAGGFVSNPVTSANPGNVTVTVRNSYVPRVMGLTAEKLWTDANDHYNVQPNAIRLQLRVSTDPADPAGWVNVGGSVLVSASSSPAWTHTWGNLPTMRNTGGTATGPGTSAHLYYSVVELAAGGVLPVYGYSTGYLYRLAAGSQGVVGGSGTSIRGSVSDPANTVHFVDITNVINTTSITVNKVWDDLVTSGANQFSRRADVVVQLYYRSGGDGNFNVAPDSTAGGNIRTLTRSNNWSEEFQSLPRRNSAGVYYQYKVEEISIGGILFSDDESAPVFPLSYSSSSTITSAIDGPGMPVAPITVTNKLAVRNNITVSKVWNDNNDFDGIRPGSVQVRLIRDMGVTGQEMVSVPIILNEANNWSHTFTNLPKFREDGVTPSTYHLFEVGVSGYEAAEYRIGTGGVFTAYTTGTSYIGSSTLLPSSALVSEAIPNAAGVHVNVRNTHVPLVDVIVTKEWIDYDNIHGLRPERLTFTLERRTGQSPFGIVPGENNIVEVASVEDDTIQAHVFRDLPRFAPSGVPYDYRVLETAATGGIVFGLSPNSDDPAKGVIGDEDGTHYIFESSTHLTPGKDGGFETTVINELIVEKIRIYGSKTWDDDFDRFGFRPDTLELRVWFYDVYEDEWVIVPSGGYTVNWTKPPETSLTSNIWTYYIYGQELIKYDPEMPDILREYVVEEVLSDELIRFYEIDIDILTQHPDTDLPEIPVNSTSGRGRNENEYIVGADFRNERSISSTSLWVSKSTDFGPNTDFYFRVYFSMNPITELNPGTLYRGSDYFKFDGYPRDFKDLLYGLDDDDERAALLAAHSHRTDDNSDPAFPGAIAIHNQQSFMIDNVPIDFYFKVVEEAHRDYMLSFVYSDELIDKVGNRRDDPTVVDVVNLAIREVTIQNITPNEGTLPTTARINAGGRVIVEDTDEYIHYDDEFWARDGAKPLRNALAVRWEPEGHWALGNTFTITWSEFGCDIVHEIIVEDYRNEDGSLKALEDCRSSNPDGLNWFIAAGASIEQRGNVVRLVLSDDPQIMPRMVTVVVDFLPTLAVNNVTVDEDGDKIGGSVMVVAGDIDYGNLNNCSDGVPDLDGTPYVASKVYGIAEEGFTTDMSYIAVRNLNDLNGVYVLLEPCEDGHFTATLPTVIAGEPDIVVKTGRITKGSIWIDFERLPVPLQVDLRFIPLDADDPPDSDPPDNDPPDNDPPDNDPPDNDPPESDPPDNDPPESDPPDNDPPDNDPPDNDPTDNDPPDNANNDSSDTGGPGTGTGGLPRTGVESIIWDLALGLLTSIVIAVAVLIVIRRQSVKDKR